MRIHLTRIAAARGPATLMVAVTVTMCLPAGAATLHVGGGGAYVTRTSLLERLRQSRHVLGAGGHLDRRVVEVVTDLFVDAA